MSNLKTSFLSINFTIIMVVTGFSGILILDDNISSSSVITVGKSGSPDYSTIQAAIDDANSGDTIEVWAGLYPEIITIEKTLTIIGNGSTNTTIDGQNSGNVAIISADYVNITGINFTGSKLSSSTVYAGIRISNSNNISLSDVVSYGNYNGIYLTYSSHCYLINVTCENNDNFGIRIRHSCVNNWIIDSISKRNTYGCDISGSGISNNRPSKIKIINSTFSQNSGVGIAITGNTKNCLIRNCTSVKNNGGLGLFECRNVSVSNSVFIGNDLASYISESNFSRFENNYFRDGDIELADTQKVIMYNNEIINGNITLSGYDDKHWDSHIIPSNNTVQGGPVKYAVNEDYLSLPQDIGEGILVNCSNISGENLKSRIFLHNCIDVLFSGVEGDIESHSSNIINISDGQGGIKLIECAFVDIYNNNLSTSSFTHYLYLWLCNNVTIRGNEILRSNLYHSGNGMTIVQSKNVNIDNNVVEHVRNDGIHINHCTDALIERNIIFDCSDSGIFSYYCKGLQIIENNISESSRYGFYGDNCEELNFSNNIIFDNGYEGLWIANTYEAIISGNTFDSNDVSLGIYTISTGNNVVIRNTFSNNDHFMELVSDGNHIYHNNFMKDTTFSTSGSMNQWDNGAGEGNYWQNYYGIDNGAEGRVLNDGIGDTHIPYRDVDNYPFINGSGWLYPGIPLISGPGAVDSGDFIVSWTNTMRADFYQLEEANDPEFSSSMNIYQGPGQEFHITDRDAGTNYYRVRGLMDDRPGDWSDVLQVVIIDPLSTPTSIAVESLPEGNGLEISWNPVGPEGSEYQISWHRAPSTTEHLINISHPESSYVLNGLVDGKEYAFKIRTIDEYGLSSPFSDEVIGIPSDTSPPEAPTDLEISDPSRHILNISWEKSPEADVMGFNLYRSENEKGGFTRINNNTMSKLYFLDTDLNVTTMYYYYITAVDEVPNESPPSITVNRSTLRGRHVHLFDRIDEDLTIKEDTVDNSSINLNEWFFNIKGETLNHSYDDNKHIDVDIDPAGPVILTPEPDWNGMEQITFEAEDGLFEVEWSINITVKEVNDPPGPVSIIKPKEGAIIERNRTVDFSADCEDPDVIYGDILEFSWKSNISGKFGTGSILDNIVLAPGTHFITLTVTDQRSLQSITTVNITVEGEPNPDGSSNDDNDGHSGSNLDSMLMAAIGAVVALVIVLLLIFLFIKPGFLKKRRKKETAPSPDKIGDEKGPPKPQLAVIKGKVTTPAQALKILELEDGATQEEIRERYREVVKENHPDKVAAMDEEFQELADTRMKRINEAYKVLTVEKKPLAPIGILPAKKDGDEEKDAKPKPKVVVKVKEKKEMKGSQGVDDPGKAPDIS